MAEFFTKEEVEIIEAFVALDNIIGARAMGAGFMADGPRAMQYGAMIERLSQATTQARRLFSLAAWRLDCERSWEVLRSHAENDAAIIAEMDREGGA